MPERSERFQYRVDGGDFQYGDIVGVEELVASTSVREFVIAEPHGLCRGAEVGIDVLDQALDMIDGREPIYFHNDLLHNNRLMEYFKSRGVIVIPDRLPNGDWDHNGYPDGALYGVSMHGAKPADTRRALEKGSVVLDFTCPLVDAEHNKVGHALGQGQEVILFGKRNTRADGGYELHPESRGTLGVDEEGGRVHFVGDEADLRGMEIDPRKQYVWVNQTTMATDQISGLRDLAKDLIPGIKVAGKGQGCYATDDRQAAVVSLAQETDGFVVVTADHSNNGTNLVKRAQQELDRRAHREDRPSETRSYLIQGLQDMRLGEWFPVGSGVTRIGISSAASTVETYLEEVLDALQAGGIAVSHQIWTNSREPNPFVLKRANFEGLSARYGIPMPVLERRLSLP